MEAIKIQDQASASVSGCPCHDGAVEQNEYLGFKGFWFRVERLCNSG